jgi:hypothetical protein
LPWPWSGWTRHIAESARSATRSTWLEYQLEIAYMELVDAGDLSATQGQWHSTLTKMIKHLLDQGVVVYEGYDAPLRDLLSRISATMKLRDHVVHSTWI